MLRLPARAGSDALGVFQRFQKGVRNERIVCFRVRVGVAIPRGRIDFVNAGQDLNGSFMLVGQI